MSSFKAFLMHITKLAESKKHTVYHLEKKILPFSLDELLHKNATFLLLHRGLLYFRLEYTARSLEYSLVALMYECLK